MSVLVHQVTGKSITRGDVGIEIETETAAPYGIPTIDGWMAKGDGSLRNFGVEYITVGAIKIDKVDEYLDNWKQGLGPIWDRLDRTSHSTSVHVHVNISDLTLTELLNFFCLSTLFENVLCEYSGVDRKGNLFCLRTKDAETKINGIIHSLNKNMNQTNIIRILAPGQYKYCAINSETVRTFNSLEFRMMRGETDPDIIKKWVKALHNIKVYAKLFECPRAILKVAREQGVMHLFTECFGSLANDFSYNNIVEDIESNLYYIANIANKVDFKSLPENMPQPKFVAELRAQQPRAPVVEEGFTEDFEEEDF